MKTSAATRHAPRRGKGSLGASESLAAGMRRLARRYLDTACRELAENPDTRQAVHETRKALKKLKALMRLLAPELGRARHRQEMRTFRDAGRLLSSLRDAEVRLHTFDSLLVHLQLASTPYAAIRGDLEQATQALSLQADKPRREVHKILKRSRLRVKDWSLDSFQPKDLVREIRRTYCQGRKALRASRKQEDDSEAFHAWRKRVKELWYHLRLAQVYLQPAAGERITEIEAIGELAGEINDLAVLKETLANRPPTPQTARLIAAIEVRIPERQREAWERGEQFYALKPREFAGKYFRAL